MTRLRELVIGGCALAAAAVLGACGSTALPGHVGLPPATTSTTTTTVAATSTTTSAIPDTSSRVLPVSAALRSLFVADFRAYKLARGEMLASDHLVACAACGPILLAYDAQDHRDYAVVSVKFTGEVSETAQVAAPDGGTTGLFWSVPAGPWIVWTNNLAPLCASEFPDVVSRLWRLSQPASCPSTVTIPSN